MSQSQKNHGAWRGESPDPYMYGVPGRALSSRHSSNGQRRTDSHTLG